MAAFDPRFDLNVEDTAAVSFTGFPVRSLIRNSSGKVGGEWVLAYQMQQKERFKLTIASTINGYSSNSISVTTPKNTPSVTSARQCHIFDKQFLLKKGYVDNPSNLCIIDVSGSDLNYYKDYGFDEFCNLVRIIASDNQLPLDAFDSFPQLQELELSLNGIVNFQITKETFSTLIKLDLSYNQINDSSITSLGLLPQLEELHLTGNNIIVLPIDMSIPHRLQNGNSIVSFPKLEKLWLDDNRLTDTTIFAILAGLRKLKYLNLDNNELVSIPHLKLLGSGMLQDPHTTQSSDDTINRLDTTSSLAPFPQLQTLSLCNNMILNSDNLLPCGVWPVFKELIIIGNPIVSMQRGLPSSLHSELVDKCNINIIRIRHTDNVHCIGKRALEFKKVSVSPPPLIPKRPIMLAIESPPSTNGSILSLANDTYFDDISTNDYESSSSSVDTQSHYSSHRQDSYNTTTQSAGGVFLTEFDQGNDTDIITTRDKTDNNTVQDTIPLHKDGSNKEENTIIKSVNDIFVMKLNTTRERYNNVSDKYKGYESLLNEDDDCCDDSPPIPTDQHSCAQVLKYALNHPLSIKRQEQKPHPLVTAKAAGKTGRYLKKTSIARQQYHNVPAVRSRTKEVDNLMEDLKSHQISCEANLKEILNQQNTMKTLLGNNEGSTPRQTPITTPTTTKQDGEKLFTELQMKYNKVKELSLATLAVIDSAHQIANTSL